MNQKLSKLQQKMQDKLKGGQFRWINEQLYTNTSEHAVSLFKKQPDLFQIYHEGFAAQVKDWPLNPNHIYIKQLRELASSRPKNDEKLVVADMGCGEAELAQQLHDIIQVHSFDLHEGTSIMILGNEFITCADIKNVPLKESSVDYCIFSLSLMGTNFVDFLSEGLRILKIGGELKVAEVKSRIENIEDFIRGVEKYGFKLKVKDLSNKMFVLMDFVKSKETEIRVSKPSTGINGVGKKTKGKTIVLGAPKLKPCLYKRR